MFRNHLIFALRLLRRDRLHGILNIIGLSAGLACSIIVLLYLQNELTYDSYHCIKVARRNPANALRYE